jgi:small-conductance mechanosensitive channel
MTVFTKQLHFISMTIDWLQVSSSNLAIAAVLAFGTDVLVNRLWHGTHFRWLFSVKKDNDRDRANGSTDTAAAAAMEEPTSGLQATLLFGATQSISASARVYLGLLAFDLFLVRFPIVDQFRAADDSIVSLREAAPVIAVTVWMGLTMCTIKRIVLLQLVSGKRPGRLVLLDRLSDYVIFLIVALCVLDALSIDLTWGFQTVLSAGGIGALIFSLAAKDLAEQIVGGFALGAW